jgi:hypothetical protein
MGEERRVYRVLVGKPEGKRPLGRPRRRWEDGIRMDHMDIGWRLVTPYGSVKSVNVTSVVRWGSIDEGSVYLCCVGRHVLS